MPILAIFGQPLSLEMRHPVVQGVVVGGDHSPFTGGDRLIAEEAERANVPKRTYVSALVNSPECLCTILHDKQIVFTCNLRQPIHITRLAIQVNRKNRSRTRRDFS